MTSRLVVIPLYLFVEHDLFRKPVATFRDHAVEKPRTRPAHRPAKDPSMHEFHRIKRLPPYVFEEVNKIKAQARAGGADIIDLGMGNPDLPAPRARRREAVRDRRQAAHRPLLGLQGHRRPAPGPGGLLRPPLRREAQSRDRRSSRRSARRRASPTWRRRSPAPGDVVLVPEPELPDPRLRLPDGGRRRSARSRPIRPPAFFPALERAVTHSIPKPIAVVVCYPSNPTAYVADLDFYRELVAFAKRHELILLSDLAYAEVYFDDKAPPPSVLQVPGALDVAVEFTSMSKTFSMAGWRIGFAVGNERLLAALARVKSYLDYGAFTPVQVAATAALNGPEDCIAEMRRDLQAPPRRPRRLLRQGRLADPGAVRLDVRLGRRSRRSSARSAASSSRSSSSRRPTSRSRPASASASTATTTSASPSSRTSSASARRRATSAASSRTPTRPCTTSCRWRRSGRSEALGRWRPSPFVGSARPCRRLLDRLRRAEDRAAAIGRRAPALLVDERLERRPARDALEPARLRRRAASARQAPRRGRASPSRRRISARGWSRRRRERHREGMAVLAAMGEREAGRVGEAVGRAVHDLGDHGERAHRARADAGRQQQLGEIGRAALGRRGERRRAGAARRRRSARTS